jgi:ubiquitin C-terminal hydrolase
MNNWSTSNSTYGNNYNRSLLSSSPQKRTIRLSSPSRSRSGPTGLSNLGNTCYISAVMQVLFQIITEADFPVAKKAQQQLTSQFFTLKKSRDRDDYKEFKLMLEDRIEIVRGWEQQDAHELLIEFIDQVRKENS